MWAGESETPVLFGPWLLQWETKGAGGYDSRLVGQLI